METNWIYESLWIIWFVVAILLIIVEFMAPGIFAIFFALGSVFAGIFSLITDNFTIQLGIFFIVSFISMIFGKKFLEQIFNINKEIKPSTIDALKGKLGIVIEKIELGNKGLVKIDGEIWTAKTFENNILFEGEKVIIKEIEGVTAIVKRYKEEESN